MTVYDCCAFLHENDLYELRLNQHWDFVDKFIVVEAGETHTGNPKSFNFDHSRFKKYESKIIYTTFDNFAQGVRRYPQLLDKWSTRSRVFIGQNTDDWTRADFHGNYLAKAVHDDNANDDDIVYLSSLDEILNQDAFEKGIAHFSQKDKLYPVYKEGQKTEASPIRPSVGFVLDTYNYKFNLRCSTNDGIGYGQMTEFAVLKHILPATMRSMGLYTHSPIEKAGWHFAWMDNTNGKDVLSKFQSWPHSKDSDPDTRKPSYNVTNEEEALQCLFSNSPITQVEMTRDTYPAYLMDNLDKYNDYIDNGWFDNYKKTNPSLWDTK